MDRILDGEITRLIIQLPPRHSKSETVSRLLPGAWLNRHPETSVMLCSYGADLAQDMSLDARTRFVDAGGELHDSARAVRRWKVKFRPGMKESGGMFAAGVRGPITGRGASLAIVDDYYRDDEQAQSPTIRRRNERWYDSSFYTRLEKDGAIVIICTRWDLKDLIGWLLEKERDGAPEHWTIVRLPAISEETQPEYPETCEVIPDFRTEPGLPLCPERMPLERLLAIKARSLPFFWSAMWQANPKLEDGDKFKRWWFSEDIFVRPEDVPYECYRVRSWDKAGTEGDGCWTVGVLWARDAQGIFYIENVIRGQWGDAEREKIIRQVTEQDNRRFVQPGRPGVPYLIEIEPGSGGKQSASITIRFLAGFEGYTERPVTNKTVRTYPLRTFLASKMVRIVRADWNHAFIEELCAYRNEKSQADQVDAASQGFTWLALQAGDDINPHRGGKQ